MVQRCKLLRDRRVILDLQARQALHLLSSGQWHDPRVPAERSRSPEPTYDAHGARNNTRALRQRAKLESREASIIEELVATCPGFRPPPGWRPKQKARTLCVPEAEIVGPEAMARMLGPRARARAEIELRTGATLTLRCAP